MPVLLGLIVHAAADGLAVGVASVSPSVKLAVAVGMAMVLHKGPVAFGLGTFLVSQRLSASRIVQVCHRLCVVWTRIPSSIVLLIVRSSMHAGTLSCVLL